MRIAVAFEFGAVRTASFKAMVGLEETSVAYS